MSSTSDDDWSVWLRFETWLWAVLLLVQLSMVAFLIIHGRKDKSFRQALYVFFVAVTVVDCALALLRPMWGWGETIFGTIYHMSVIEQEDPTTHKMEYYPTVGTMISQIVKHAVVPALGHAQPLFLTAIAVNRFTAFAFPLKHASMWRPRTVFAVTALLSVMSVTFGAALPVVDVIRHAVKCSRANSEEEREEIRCGSRLAAFEKVFLPSALITFTSAICCVVSFVLNVGSIAMLVVLRTTGRLQRKGPELQLFAHSLWMFLLQVFLAFQDIVYFADKPDYVGSDLGLEFTLADWAHSSEWLAGANASRKWVEGEFAFTPGCIVAKGCYADDDALPMCSAWYRLLIGELRLREHPDFTLRTHELCLFALSGSIFLLVVSGNVRNAYFNFYVKWQCLKKKRAQKNSVNLFTRTARGAPTLSVSTRAGY